MHRMVVRIYCVLQNVDISLCVICGKVNPQKVLQRAVEALNNCGLLVAVLCEVTDVLRAE
jgi:hypothetical protein